VTERGEEAWSETHVAALAAQQHVQNGYRVVVNVICRSGSNPFGAGCPQSPLLHTSMTALHHALAIAYFDRLDMPRLT